MTRRDVERDGHRQPGRVREGRAWSRHRRRVADHRYTSQSKALAGLTRDLYLVTVRPPDETLWLVAVLRAPVFTGEFWEAAPNTQPIVDITSLVSALQFTNGQGLPAKPGTRAMSLQTARTLTPEDLAVLAGATEATADALFATALAALRAGHPHDALVELVTAWDVATRTAAPPPPLARAIATLSDTVHAPAPANLRGKTAAAHVAWNEHAAAARAADLPALLASLCDVSSADAAERLAVVTSWLPDPRVESALVDVANGALHGDVDAPVLDADVRGARGRAGSRAAPTPRGDRFRRRPRDDARWLRGKHAKLLAALEPVFARPAPPPSTARGLSARAGIGHWRRTIAPSSITCIGPSTRRPTTTRRASCSRTR